MFLGFRGLSEKIEAWKSGDVGTGVIVWKTETLDDFRDGNGRYFGCNWVWGKVSSIKIATVKSKHKPREWTDANYYVMVEDLVCQVSCRTTTTRVLFGLTLLTKFTNIR